MKKLILFIFLILISCGFSQNKYFIYFRDKGINPTDKLSRDTHYFQDAANLLSEKCIQRRFKNMGEDNFITYDDVPLNEDYIHSLESLGIRIENKLKWFNAVTSYLTEIEKNKIQNLFFVEKVEPINTFVFKGPEYGSFINSHNHSSYKYSFDYGPSFDQLQLSDIPAVQDKGITGSGVLLGLLDTGFNWKNHESLKDAKVIAEYDFINHDSSTSNSPLDDPAQHNHGTLVFSIVGGFKEGSLIGSAFGADFILAKTEDIRSERHIEEDNYAAALEWMENYGVDITSSSLGYSTFDPPEFSYTYADMNGKTTIVTRAAELAFRRGVVTVTSAGNEGATSWHYITAPADGFNTLGIGAVNNNNEVANFSSRGPTYDGRIKPDLVARGASDYGANANDFSGYLNASGTSLSAPIASGVAALLLSAFPYLKNTQVRNILLETADNSRTPNNDRGYGLISALRAIEFPNLNITGNTSFRLNKLFLNNDIINSQTVKIHYSANGNEYIDQQMNPDGNLKYTFNLPYFFNNDLIDFYFTYDDNSGNSFRIPLNNTYRFYYGSLDLSLNLSPELSYNDYVVSEPYPNPFYPVQSTFTSLSIKTSGNENLTIKIIDPLGQQVFSYNAITSGFDFRFDWYGESDNGFPLASGAYYLLVDLNGRKFRRNLILLR